jgi:hypothetical protein
MIHILELDKDNNDDIIDLVHSERDIDDVVNYIMTKTPKDYYRSETAIRNFLGDESLFYYHIEEKYYCAIDSDRKTNRIIFTKYVKFISINRDNKLKILGI